MKTVKNLSEFTAIIAKPGLTVVDFTASWCGPCKQIAPFFEELARKYPDVAFIKVDVDEAAEIAQAQAVRQMPTFKFFLKGEMLEMLQGANGLEERVIKYKGLSAPADPFAGTGHSLAASGSSGVTADPRAARLARFGVSSANPPKLDLSKACAPAATANASADAGSKDANAEDEDEEMARAIAMSMETTDSADSKSSTASASTTSTSADIGANAVAKRAPLADDTPDAEEIAARKKEKEDDPHELVPLPVDEALLAELISMGFSDIRARKGLHYGVTVDGAVNWLADHDGDANIDDEFLVRKSDINKVPLTPEEVAAKMAELKVLALKRKKEREAREAKEALVAEKERRERGANITATQEERARLARLREGEKIKKEKADAKAEKTRILNEIARDKAARAKNNGVLPSVLGVDGYNPSAIQYDQEDKNAPAEAKNSSPSPATVLSAVAAAVPAASGKPIENPEETIDSNIQTLLRYKTRGDGGNAIKLLLLFVKNVAENPTEIKYRSINTESNAFKTKLGSLVGPVTLLRALGFEKNDEGKMVLNVPDTDTASFVPIFQSTVSKLQAAGEKFVAENPN